MWMRHFAMAIASTLPPAAALNGIDPKSRLAVRENVLLFFLKAEICKTLCVFQKEMVLQKDCVYAVDPGYPFRKISSYPLEKKAMQVVLFFVRFGPEFPRVFRSSLACWELRAGALMLTSPWSLLQSRVHLVNSAVDADLSKAKTLRRESTH